MARKKKIKMDEFSEFEEVEVPAIEFETNEPVSYEKETNVLSVKLLTSRVFKYGGVDKYLVVTVDRPMRGFLVNLDDIASRKEMFEITLEHLIEVYNWESEIKSMLVDFESVYENVLKSFWRVGAFDKEMINDIRIRNGMLDSAFPYRLKEDN